jgi:hypothetical protein
MGLTLEEGGHLMDRRFMAVRAVLCCVGPPNTPPGCCCWRVQCDWNAYIRVRVEIMGPENYEHAGKSQPVLILIDPIIFTRSRISVCRAGVRPRIWRCVLAHSAIY